MAQLRSSFPTRRAAIRLVGAFHPLRCVTKTAFRCCGERLDAGSALTDVVALRSFGVCRAW